MSKYNNIIDFRPSDKLLRLQAIELDLLKELQRVCAKHNLKCFACGGTLIGAARHQGFIPWDDDIDMQMLWDDYKKLMEIAPNEFQAPYYFQCYKTDVNAEVSHARLRNSETTGCTKWDFENIKNPSFNRGIFIDIFPLFPIAVDEQTRIKQKEKIDGLWKAIRGWNAYQNNNAGYVSAYEKYIPFWVEESKRHTIAEIKQLYIDACIIDDEDSDCVGMTSFRTNSDRHIWKKNCFEETVELPFEDINIISPKEYDEVLAKTYGDWRTPVFDSSVHEMFLFDTDVPYTKKTEFNI